MMEFVTQATNGMLDYAWRILYASMLFFVLELVIGWNKYSIRSRLRSAFFWGVYIVITMTCFTAFQIGWAKLGIQPLFKVNLRAWSTDSLTLANVIMWVVAPVAAIIVGEFFYYWFHRMQHANKFLWAFHAEHHAIREMSAWNSNHHVTEEIFRIPLMIIPLSLLIQVEHGYVPALVWLLIGMQGQYVHSHTKLNLGPLRYIVADNRFHRIHHSNEARHFDRNFGSFTSVWDSVFRTAYFPKPGEWPDTGIAEHDEPKTLRDFLFRPIRKLRGKA
jgi:sterol desaturase/sphingolipid hydroxylase (fatty acid hydroxylase superfamily)